MTVFSVYNNVHVTSFRGRKISLTMAVTGQFQVPYFTIFVFFCLCFFSLTISTNAALRQRFFFIYLLLTVQRIGSRLKMYVHMNVLPIQICMKPANAFYIRLLGGRIDKRRRDISINIKNGFSDI